MTTAEAVPATAATGTTLLHTGPDGRLTLTRHGEQSTRDAMPALKPFSRSARIRETPKDGRT